MSMALLVLCYIYLEVELLQSAFVAPVLTLALSDPLVYKLESMRPPGFYARAARLLVSAGILGRAFFPLAGAGSLKLGGTSEGHSASKRPRCPRCLALMRSDR